MHLSVKSAVMSFWILSILTYPTVGIVVDKEFIYFPDQADYIKLSSVKCPSNLILWPGNRRCYREGEQGPCDIGRVLTMDKRFLKPSCKAEDSK
ncbi:hypothetical protein WH47_08039 [Habropoda laboriosa]|uniref:DUF4789 domain-containing protein n=1 Tax=Habropoda laboriosa TaxID=597456 RepID=A0A0L7RF79_9HYME|nr:hypothetical protein WH47_08039 [Habropoda laboriosa]